MKTNYFALGCFILLCLSSVVRAQEKTDSAYEKIAPFVKENTFLVAHVDLKKLELDTFFDKFQERAIRFTKEGMKLAGIEEDPASQIEEIESDIGTAKTTAAEALAQFSNAGAEEFYFLSGMENLQSCVGLLAVPGEIDVNEDLREMLDSLYIYHAGVLDGMTFFVMTNAGMTSDTDVKTILKQYGTFKVKDRPEFNTAFNLQGKSPIRVVFGPSIGLRGMAQMMLPMAFAQSPTPVDQETQKFIMSLVNTTQSVSIGATPESLRLNIAVQFSSEKIAKETEDKIRETYEDGVKNAGDSMAQYPEELRTETLKIIENTKPLVADLFPKANKDRLVLVVDEKLIDKHEKLLIQTSADMSKLAPFFMMMGMPGDDTMFEIE